MTVQISSPSVFTRSFISANQAITSAGLVTVAHGLGVIPKMCSFSLVCTTADNGWSVNNIIENIAPNGVGPTTTDCFAQYSDASNIYWRYNTVSACFAGLNKTTGATVNLTNASWAVIVKVYA